MRLAALLALAGACAKPAPPPEDLTFPASFLFGTAIAGFQVDMGCPTIAASECEDTHSDWYKWVTSPTLLADPALGIVGDPPDAGPGFYELYPADLDRAKNELHNDAVRLSLEWSRLFPTSTAGVDGYLALKAIADPKALAFYHAVFAAMKARGLTPLVTLNHYTLPDWIHDAEGCHANLDTCSPRGWLDKDTTVREIAKYAGFAAKEFGGEVDWWATENEPFSAVVLAGYVQPSADRSNPPGVSLKWADAKLATLAMEEAHARMYDAVKANDTVSAAGDGVAARVGLVYNLVAISPKSAKNPDDVQAAADVGYLFNDMFLNAAINGDVDTNYDGKTTHRDDLAGRMDYLGVNYYVHLTVEGLGASLDPLVSPKLTFNPLTLKTDWTDAAGIGPVLAHAHATWNLPLVVTETGREDAANTGVAAKWVADTLTYTRRAMSAGADVRGYFYWTLMDNYEWNHGMTIRMGLYAVDKADPAKTRRARSGVAVYGRIAGARSVPPDLAAP